MRKINKLKVAKGCLNLRKFFTLTQISKKLSQIETMLIDYDLAPILEDLSQSETIIINLFATSEPPKYLNSNSPIKFLNH